MPKKDVHDRPGRILTAAAQLIAHHGYDKVTVSDIAHRAGISKGAIYLHWSSKEKLFEALLIHEMKRLIDDLLKRVEADPKGGTIARMYLHALLALQDNAVMRALYTRDSRVLGDYIRRQNPTRYTQRFLFGKDFVREMQLVGLIRNDLSSDVIAYLMSVMSYGFTSIETIIPAKEAPPLDEVAAAFSDLIQRAFAQKGGNSQEGKRALDRLADAVNQQYEVITKSMNTATDRKENKK